MTKRKSTNPMKQSNFWQWKASTIRSSWRTRARKYKLDLDSVPTRVEIQEWLEAQAPVKCYIAGSFISPEVMEVDHKIPLSRGGKLTLDNCGVTSRFYNGAKGTLTEKEFRQLLKVISKWDDKGSSLLQRLISSNNIYRKKR